MGTTPRNDIHASAVVSNEAELGPGVSIGAFTVVNAGVTVGAGTVIGSHCVIGESATSLIDSADHLATRIGPDSTIRSHTVIYQKVTIGAGLRSGHRVTIREGSVIGEGVGIGTLSDLQGDLTIGNHVRLHSSVFIAQKSILEDFVWLFPFVVLTNDPHPPSDTCTAGARIARYAVVAARSVVMPGVDIGEHSLVGAMSLVTGDVPAETVVLGVPAKPRGSIRDVQCQHGALDAVYPWPRHFRRGYPDGALPDAAEFE